MSYIMMGREMTSRDRENVLISAVLRLEVGVPYLLFAPQVGILLSAVALCMATEYAYGRTTSLMKRALLLMAGGLVQTAIPVGLLVATSRYRWPDLGWPKFNQEKFELMVLYGGLACLGIAAWRSIAFMLVQFVQLVEQRRTQRQDTPRGGARSEGA
jgi:hypothetical protein